MIFHGLNLRFVSKIKKKDFSVYCLNDDAHIHDAAYFIIELNWQPPWGLIPGNFYNYNNQNFVTLQI